MLIYVPFIFFSLVAFIHFRKVRRIDIGCLIAIEFAISGLFSILIDLFDLRYADSVGYEISAGASLAYCGLLFLCLLPILKFPDTRQLTIKPIKSERVLKFLAVFAFLWLIFSAFMYRSNIIESLTGDMLSARADRYMGVKLVTWMNFLPTPIRLAVALINSIFGCPWTLCLLAFYSRFVQKMEKKYFFMFLISSMNGPMMGIIGADRSAVAYWILSLILMSVLFSAYMTSRDKKNLLKVAIIFIGVFSVYLAFMTIARFEGRDYGSDYVNGPLASLVSYFGQSYINFCCFFDNYEPPFPHFGILFPFTSEYILGVPSGGTIIQEQMELLTNFQTGVFYTFIGQIIMGAGKWTAMAFCVIYSLSSSILRSHLSSYYICNLSKLYLIFAFASVMFLGVFVHYYTSPYITFGLVAMFLIIKKIE